MRETIGNNIILSTLLLVFGLISYFSGSMIASCGILNFIGIIILSTFGLIGLILTIIFLLISIKNKQFHILVLAVLFVIISSLFGYIITDNSNRNDFKLILNVRKALINYRNIHENYPESISMIKLFNINSSRFKYKSTKDTFELEFNYMIVTNDSETIIHYPCP